MVQLLLFDRCRDSSVILMLMRRLGCGFTVTLRGSSIKRTEVDTCFVILDGLSFRGCMTFMKGDFCGRVDTTDCGVWWLKRNRRLEAVQNDSQEWIQDLRALSDVIPLGLWLCIWEWRVIWCFIGITLGCLMRKKSVLHGSHGWIWWEFEALVFVWIGQRLEVLNNLL